MKSLGDVGNIVVKTTNGLPVLVRDVARVQFGYANRFGALTANGEGEKVFGQIMILKNANSKEVIRDVKARVEEVQKAVVCAVAPCSRRDGSGGVERVWDYVARAIVQAVGLQLTLLHESDSPFGGSVLAFWFHHLVVGLLQMPCSSECRTRGWLYDYHFVENSERGAWEMVRRDLMEELERKLHNRLGRLGFVDR